VAINRRSPGAGIAERLRRDYSRWDDEDVRWAVVGFARMDAEPFVQRFTALARDAGLHPHLPDRIVGAAPAAYVLVGDASAGSVLSPVDREELARRLPAGHVISIEGGHCLHRDATAEWLAAVASIID
jgi:pimeloyl-ACP methyl ester carboxylesterase